MCPQQLGATATQLCTTINSLTSAKISTLIKMLSLASCFTLNMVSTRNPRHNLCLEI